MTINLPNLGNLTTWDSILHLLLNQLQLKKLFKIFIAHFSEPKNSKLSESLI